MRLPFLAQVGILEIIKKKIMYNFDFIIFSFQQNILGTLFHMD